MLQKTFLVIALALLALVSAYADNVEVKNVEDNQGAVYEVTTLELGELAHHDRGDLWKIIPEEFQGLTNIQTSIDNPGAIDYRLTFEINRSAFVYIAWNIGEWGFTPGERDQDPEDWFNDGFTDTEKSMYHTRDQMEYRIYKSNDPYHKGKVEIMGVDPLPDDPVYQWTIFFDATGAAVTAESGKLITIWAEIKTPNR